MSALSPLNRAFNQIPKRAEKQEGPQLHETFVDSGVVDVINTIDHQVIYGRRGTGKTHALSYLGSEAAADGGLAANIQRDRSV
jgi:Cdc6-like AAA superfamily ATPase